MKSPQPASQSKEQAEEHKLLDLVDGHRLTENISAQPQVIKVFSWVVTILVPLALVLTSVRLLLTPTFVHFEYRTPNFPHDPYGFTREDRLDWSLIALDYLLNDEDISFLANLRFPDGSPVYNQRELDHMEDVKDVVQAALVVWYGSLLGLVILGLWAWRANRENVFRQSLARGGLLTTFLVGAIILLVLLAFGFFFVKFHEVFFAPGTWMFRYSDTLIRLFPERFWRDAFLAIGMLSAGGGILLWFGLRKRFT